MKTLLFTLLFFVPLYSYANTPSCHTHAGGPYCSYKGKVSRIYVNSGNIILMYFESAVPAGAADNVGISGATQRVAGAIKISDNPDFANYFYSTALAAQASGREVSIQMRNTVSGYLKIDRIWLSAP